MQSLNEKDREMLGEMIKTQFEIAAKTNFERVKEFHKAFGEADPAELCQIEPESIELRAKLIWEELLEVFEELDVELTFNLETEQYDIVHLQSKPINHAKLAKELCDLLYVVYGCASKFGIPIDECYAEVHRSNMSKLGLDGKPVFREDGKILKGPNFSPADIESVLKDVQ